MVYRVIGFRKIYPFFDAEDSSRIEGRLSAGYSSMATLCVRASIGISAFPLWTEQKISAGPQKWPKSCVMRATRCWRPLSLLWKAYDKLFVACSDPIHLWRSFSTARWQSARPETQKVFIAVPGKVRFLEFTGISSPFERPCASELVVSDRGTDRRRIFGCDPAFPGRPICAPGFNVRRVGDNCRAGLNEKWPSSGWTASRHL